MVDSGRAVLARALKIAKAEAMIRLQILLIEKNDPVSAPVWKRRRTHSTFGKPGQPVERTLRDGDEGKTLESGHTEPAAGKLKNSGP